MNCTFRVCKLVLLLLGAAATPLWAQQTRIEAPGGVAAQRIENSPITVGLPPAEQIRLVEIFSQQIAVSAEARAQAEARATKIAAEYGFTINAVIGLFRILGEQDV